MNSKKHEQVPSTFTAEEIQSQHHSEHACLFKDTIFDNIFISNL